MPRKTAVKSLSASAKLIKAAHAPTPAEEREAAFQHIAAQISEFFDAGYLVVSWVENGETMSMDVAVGNKFAAQGMIQEAAEKMSMDEVDLDDYGDGLEEV